MPNQTITAQQANYKSADPVADYFLTAINGKAGEFMSNLKLQKLCYLAQGWHLAYLDKPLFDDEIEAWAHGPVVVELYRRFKNINGNRLIYSIKNVTLMNILKMNLWNC